ncbi:alpha beta-hydrolase [Mycena leptocephala]|nr:alpha beta-hydrolase [Mycena leptocephala]
MCTLDGEMSLRFTTANAAACILAIFMASLLTTEAAPTIDLGYAKYQGSVDTSANITTFLGIRYAASPTGELRFRAPQPPQTVAGVLNATTQPDQCFQAGGGTSATNPLEARAVSTISSSTNPLRARSINTTSSEDCLFLNVNFPSDIEGVPQGPLPVIVWIHGGGYVEGSASQYNGTDILKQSNRGLVIVTIQYRLGLFGFLPGSEVKKNGTLNAGLLDQDFALRWVNQHISKFGGDPEKVTIWGASAGAGSVLQHVVANGGQTKPQLFRAAITSSTYLPSQYQYNDRIPELLYSEVVAQTNCAGTTSSLACLRAADVNSLENVNMNISAAGFFATSLFVPVVDGEFIVQRPTLSLAQGKVNGKALLSVTNAFEGTLAVNQSAPANATQYALDLFPNFGPAQADGVGALYAGLGTPLFQTDAVVGESILICPTYYLLRAFAGRSFKGEFAVPPAVHGIDDLYYFSSMAVDAVADNIPFFNNTAFIDAFAQTFTSFAISLDPNIKISRTITPKWNIWSAGNTEMLFNKTDNDIPVVTSIKTSDSLLERCQFWDSVGSFTSQ